ncbi:MAG: hypothetical protein ACK5O7_04745 [Holosporales bacterium]
MSVEKNSKSVARDQQRQAKLARHGAQNSKLGMALRTNLRLRKAQQRARQDMQVKSNNLFPDVACTDHQQDLSSAHEQKVQDQPPACIPEGQGGTNAR